MWASSIVFLWKESNELVASNHMWTLFLKNMAAERSACVQVGVWDKVPFYYIAVTSCKTNRVHVSKTYRECHDIKGVNIECAICCD